MLAVTVISALEVPLEKGGSWEKISSLEGFLSDNLDREDLIHSRLSHLELGRNWPSLQ